MKRSAAKSLLLAGTVVLMAMAALGFLGWQEQQNRLAELARNIGAVDRQPDLLRQLRRRLDSPQARLVLARALLAQELDPSWKALLPEARRLEEERRGSERLALVRELGAEALTARPSSWEAATILGAAIYLDWSRGSAPELISRIERWEGPLLLARRLAPNEPEPTRFLASAYLSQWSRLPVPKQEEAKQVLQASLRDPTSFELLLEPWLRVAPSQQEALGVLPETPSAWQRVQDFYRHQPDLERLANANRRWFETLSPAAIENLSEGRRYRRGGDERKAVEAFGWVLRLPPEVTLAPHFEAALLEMRPQQVGKAAGRSLERWLDWALVHCAHTDCPLSPRTFDLLTLVLTDLSYPDLSTLHLLSGHQGLANLYESRSGRSGSKDWSLYYLMKAKQAAGEKDLATAEQAYLAVGGPVAESLAYEQLGRELAGLGAKRVSARDLEPEISGLAGSFRAATAWQDRTPGVFLEGHVGERARQLWLQIGPGAEPGTVLEIQLQGRRLGAVPVSSGARLRIEVDLSPGAKLLEIRSLAGRLPAVSASI